MDVVEAGNRPAVAGEDGFEGLAGGAAGVEG